MKSSSSRIVTQVCDFNGGSGAATASITQSDVAVFEQTSAEFVKRLVGALAAEYNGSTGSPSGVNRISDSLQDELDRFALLMSLYRDACYRS